MPLEPIVDTHHIPLDTHTIYPIQWIHSIVDTKFCYHTLFHAPSHPPQKIIRNKIVFDFLTTEYFRSMACVKFKPITHIIAKSPNYTTLAWAKFELDISI